MSVIISTMAIKKKFFVALSKQIIIDEWLTPNTIPCDEKTIISLVRKITLKKENVIIITKYGKRAPADFPKICTEGLLISLLFYKMHSDISNWIEVIGSYHANPPNKALVLGMLKPFYIKWAEKIYDCLKMERYQEENTFKHLPDVTTNIELAHELSDGCVVAIYVGHGRSRGWSGYRGFRWSHVNKFIQNKPIGTMISLSCSSLKQDKTESMPLGMKWVMEGRNCVFLGSTEAVKIKPLEEITRILLEGLSTLEVQRVDQLILKMNDKIRQLNKPDINSTWSSFRLIGNPFQAL